MFIQIEIIFNFDVLKFLLGCDVLGDGVWEYCSVEEVVVLFLVEVIFVLEGVCWVFLGGDFLIVICDLYGLVWFQMKVLVLVVIMEYFILGVLVLCEVGESDDDVGYGYDLLDYEGEIVQVVVEIKDLLDSCICLVVVQDGGDIIFSCFEVVIGVVWLYMCGVCLGCLLFLVILCQDVEILMKYYVFEVKQIEVVL